jgi:hypothetical protein
MILDFRRGNIMAEEILYECDPDKNINCSKLSCAYNPDAINKDCHRTAHIEFRRAEMDLKKNFTYHAPKEGQPEKYTAIREKGHEFAEMLQKECPQSRELSLALTNLEQVVMWANASIARNE